MTNFALLALTMTLAAEPADELAPGPAATAEPAAAPVPGPAAPVAPLAKPAEGDIEVLDEVVDLQADEDPTAGWYGANYPSPLRVLALPTARAHRAGGWEIFIDHRSTAPIYDNSNGHGAADLWNNFVGLDSPVRVGLGFRYGLIDDLDLGIYRSGSSRTDTYELDLRYQILHQATMGLDLAARYGASWFSQPYAKDAAGFYGQVLATRLFANRVLVNLGAFYHSNSTNDTKYNQDKAWSVAAGGGIEVRLAAPVAIAAESVSCSAGYCSKNPTFSAGIKYFTNRHAFTLLVGNTNYLTADGYITNTDRPWSKLSIGFNIRRSH
jgi:hypothetical protein